MLNSDCQDPKYGALRDFVAFVQFKKREKHPWRSEKHPWL